MNTTGQDLIASLTEAVGYIKGTSNNNLFAVHTFPPAHIPETIDVKAIRQNMGFSQALFASTFGLSLYTLRNWEQGKRKPDPAARAYLKVIEAAPETVRQVLCRS